MNAKGVMQRQGKRPVFARLSLALRRVEIRAACGIVDAVVGVIVGIFDTAGKICFFIQLFHGRGTLALHRDSDVFIV